MGFRGRHTPVIALLVICLCLLPVPGWAQAPPAPATPPAPPAQPPPPTQVKAIEIRGNKRIPREQILAAVTATRAGQPLSEEKLRADIRAINELGLFADVAVRTETEQDGLVVVFLVTENPVVAEIVVEGNTVISGDEIRRALAVPVGEVLNINKMRDGARAVQKLYEDKGYVLARVADLGLLPVEGAVDQARLRVRIAEGTVEAVRFSGLRKTKESMVRRHITVKPGDVFNVNALNRDLQRLFNLELFESIRALPQPGATSDSVVVVVEVKEARTSQIAGGVGYSTAEGLLGFLEYRDRNWQGLGQSFTVRAERSIQQEGLQRFNYEIAFTEPFLDERTAMDLSLFSRASVEREYSGGVATSRFELQRTGSLIGVTRPLDATTTATLRLKSEYTNFVPLPLDPNDPASPVVPPSLLTPGRVVTLQLFAVQDGRDDRFAPTRGQRIALTTDFSLRALGSDFGFAKYAVDYQQYIPLGKGTTVVGRLFYGASSGTLPVQEQYVLGGLGTVRAFAAGRFRADSMVVANVEYRFPFSALFRQLTDLQGVVFVDVGNAPVSFTDLKVGYGIGVAIKTPLGPIRIDLAFGPEGRQVWLSLGSPF